MAIISIHDNRFAERGAEGDFKTIATVTTVVYFLTQHTAPSFSGRTTGIY